MSPAASLHGDPLDEKHDQASIPSEHIEVREGVFWAPEEEKKLVRKIDAFLMPAIWLMYLLSYMDRTKSVVTLLMCSWLLRDSRLIGLSRVPVSEMPR